MRPYERLDAIARGMLRPINPYSTLILGTFTALWGLWVILPGWDAFGTAQIFHLMGEFAPEWAWGTWAILAGCLVNYAVFKGMMKCLSYTLLFIGWHWFTVSCLMWFSDWQNTAGMTYTFVTIFSAYAYLNIHLNYVRFAEHEKSIHM